MIDSELFWDIDNSCTISKEDIVQSTDDYLWDDFDESDWIRDNYDRDDLWDAIRNGDCYDDFVDKMREDCSDNAWERVSEGMDESDDDGVFEVCGTGYCKMHFVTEYF